MESYAILSGPGQEGVLCPTGKGYRSDKEDDTSTSISGPRGLFSLLNYLMGTGGGGHGVGSEGPGLAQTRWSGVTGSLGLRWWGPRPRPRPTGTVILSLKIIRVSLPPVTPSDLMSPRTFYLILSLRSFVFPLTSVPLVDPPTPPPARAGPSVREAPLPVHQGPESVG